uniref:Uncharacterized protein n=1 Tax=Arundo donax TaxID=35708 RepID=A0A0A8YZE5_ARUDO
MMVCYFILTRNICSFCV